MSFYPPPIPIPTVKELHSAVDGEGLEISGWFATWDQDTHDESFLPNAFTASLPAFLKDNPVALWQHDKKSPPIGRVTSAFIDRAKGLYGTIVLPRPAEGTKAFEIYDSVKNGLVRAFSVGGVWQRHNVGGQVKLMCKRLLEVSLAPLPVNTAAQVTGGVTAVQDVKSFGAEWVPAAEYDQRARDWLTVQRLQPQLELASLRLDVAAILLQR